MRTVLVIVGALGILKKVFDDSIQVLPGHPLASKVQKTYVLMGTTHIFGEALG